MNFDQWWTTLTAPERHVLGLNNSKYVWDVATQNAELRAQSVSVFDEQARFMQACDQTVMTENRQQYLLYRDLMAEEMGELIDADTKDDLIEQADAIIDILVVTIGAGLSLGLPLDMLWKEVMRSNTAKIDPNTGMVKKRADGKVLKPDGWTPPNIEAVLRGEA
jgi:predicted HAD superfamily Cof-like phosphohydrolase